MKNGRDPKSWRGQVDTQVEAPRFRWQSGAANKEDSPVRSSVKAISRLVLLLLMIALGMLAFFVFLILYVPMKTPLLTVAATEYGWPFPPNAWSYEDTQAFSQLDGKTIQWNDSGNAWNTRKAALDDLKSRLQVLQSSARKSGVLVLYVSAHGAVDDKGLPCIIPTNANPLTPSQWLSIDDLASTIANNTPAAVDVLLVLDCVHQRVNWQTAQIDNTFVERIEDWFDRTNPQHLYLLTSTSSGEQAWAGPELKSSIFAKLFRIGLAGAADQLTGQGAHRGNGDGVVSLLELISYVRRGVSDWVHAHRGSSQSPRIFPAQPTDLRLGLSLKNWDLGKLMAESQSSDVAPGNLSIDELGSLWQAFDRLRQLKVFQYDPKNWADLEHKLLWLDQLSAAGKGYADLATQQVYPEIAKQLEQIGSRAAELGDSQDFVAKSNILERNLDSALLSSPLPSLALKELTGVVKPGFASELRRQLLSNLEPINQAATQLSAHEKSYGATNQTLNEFNFVKLLKKYGADSIWPDRNVLVEAVNLRNECEQLIVYGDVRGHRWNRLQFNVIDRHRRAMEDQLMLGPSEQFTPSLSGLKTSVAALTAPNPLTAPNQGTRERIENAWSVRDRSLVELSYLAAWVCSPDNNMVNLGEWSGLADSPTTAPIPVDILDTVKNDPFLRERTAVQMLIHAIRGAHELGALLCNSKNLDDQRLDQLNEAVLRVEHDLDSLQLLVKDHVARALSAVPGSNSTPAAVTGLLGLPFLELESRNDLQRKLEKNYRDAIERDARKKVESRSLPINLLGGSSDSDGTNPGSPSLDMIETQLPEADFSDRMRGWEEHPLLTILRMKESPAEIRVESEPGTDTKETSRDEIAIEAVNAALRRYYLSVQSFKRGQVTEWMRSNRLELISTGEENAWVNAGLAEHVERAYAPVCPVRSETNAAADFRNLALQDLLLWYANRSIDDFYADADKLPQSSPASEDFYERSVLQVIDFMTLIAEPTNDLKQGMQSTQDRLAVLGPLARSGISTTVKQGPPVAGSNRRILDLTIQPTLPQLAFGNGENMQLPPGVAMAVVRSSQSILPDIRIPVPMPITKESSSLSLTCPPLDRTLPHEMVVVYRGHEFKSPLFVGQGIMVDFKPMRYDTADVVLFGDLQRQPSLVFVLDCSWSMGEPLPVESMDTRTTSKLELAKQQVSRMLTQIAARPDSRVGLRLFGHRLGWSRPTNDKMGLQVGKTEILAQPDYPGSIPQDVVPSTDVEAVLPLGRFTPEMVAGLNTKLSRIVPWGQSPLYFAIIQSLQDFASEEAESTRSIVVITDGDNFQFNTSGRPGGEAGASTTLEDVERAWKNTQIPLFILGVGISESSNPNTRNVLEGLAERTGGKYYDVENGNDLLRALSEQLSLGVYHVTSEDASQASAPAPSMESKLNSPIKIDGIQNRSPNYEVSFQNTSRSVQLEGGESLELFLRGDGQEIVAQPYDRLSPRAGTLVRAGDSARMIARVHRPSQIQDGMNFPISIQNPDSHYTPRPTQLWIEISPVMEKIDPARSPYAFYDVNYEPETPVPLVAWTASNWPANATLADVRIWAKYQPTPALQSIPLKSVVNDPQRFAVGIETAGVEGVTLRVHVLENRPGTDLLEIQVTEIHGDRSPGVGSLRVLLDGNEIGLPVRITRRFEASNRMAIHTFAFEPTIGKALLRSPEARLSVSSRAAVIDGAWHLEGGKSIRVDVVRASALLPLESSVVP